MGILGFKNIEIIYNFCFWYQILNSHSNFKNQDHKISIFSVFTIFFQLVWQFEMSISNQWEFQNLISDNTAQIVMWLWYPPFCIHLVPIAMLSFAHQRFLPMGLLSSLRISNLTLGKREGNLRRIIRICNFVKLSLKIVLKKIAFLQQEMVYGVSNFLY
jgi:hypothetical protein